MEFVTLVERVEFSLVLPDKVAWAFIEAVRGELKNGNLGEENERLSRISFETIEDFFCMRVGVDPSCAEQFLAFVRHFCLERGVGVRRLP